MTRLGWIYLILISILFGVALGFLGFFAQAFALILIAFVFIIFSIVSIVDLFTKTSRWKNILPVLFATFLILIISLIPSRIHDTTQKRKADRIIKKLYEYKKNHNSFPETLSQIDQPGNFSYTPEHLFTEFKLSYSTDGWHMRTFNSEDSTWLFHD